MTVEAKAYAALSGSAKLTALLAAGAASVYHNQSPDAGTYPVIIFRTLTDAPHQHADNVFTAHMTVIRVHILTADGVVSALSELVRSVMLQAGFMWENSADGAEDDYYYRAMDFSIAEEVN